MTEMSDDELLIVWREADCPLDAERVGEGIRVSLSDDPLNFVVLAPKAFNQFLQRLQELAGGL
jgi:hypothetical protein